MYFPYFGNFTKHLNEHTQYLEWEKYYNVFKKKPEYVISEKTFILIQYIISSNTALRQIKNSHFSRILDIGGFIQAPNYAKLRKLIDLVYKKLMHEISVKLNSARYVTLIADIWSSKIGHDFIGIAVSLTFGCLARENIVISCELMKNDPKEEKSGHTAENIKFTIASVLKRFKDFDTSKIKGNFIIIFRTIINIKILKFKFILKL